MCGTPDVHLLKDSWTAFTRLCRRTASINVTTYPTIVELQSAVSVEEKDRIIGAPAGGRRAIASKAVSTGVKSISCIPSSLILSSNSGPRTKECCLKKGEISISAWYSSSVRWLLAVIVIHNDFRSVDFDIGVPLTKSHIHNVFEPVNVDNGQTEEKGQVACFRVYVQGIALPREKARWVWMGLAGPAVAEVRMFWTRLRGIK